MHSENPKHSTRRCGPECKGCRPPVAKQEHPDRPELLSGIPLAVSSVLVFILPLLAAVLGAGLSKGLGIGRWIGSVLGLFAGIAAALVLTNLFLKKNDRDD